MADELLQSHSSDLRLDVKQVRGSSTNTIFDAMAIIPDVAYRRLPSPIKQPEQTTRNRPVRLVNGAAADEQDVKPAFLACKAGESRRGLFFAPL